MEITTTEGNNTIGLPRLLFTIKQAAEILSVSEKSIRRLIQRGLLKVNPGLRTKLITRKSLEAFAGMTTSLS